MNNIIQTKIKFSRNLKGFKFESNIDDIEQQEVLKLCLKAVNDCGLKCVELKDLSKNVIDNLLAREVMEREFVYSSYNQGIANDKDLIIQIKS